MAIFVFKRYYEDSKKEIKNTNVWIRADNKLDAQAKVWFEYPNSTKFVLLRVE